MKLKNINKNERKILENMLQLYLHDISNYFLIDFNSRSGLYEYDDLNKYFDNSGNTAFFMQSDNDDIVGFILLDKVDNGLSIQEIFVLNNYKNKNIGAEAVNTLFDTFKSNWTIKALPCSDPAQKFWERTIKNYTNNNFQVEFIGKYNRAIFTFNNME